MKLIELLERANVITDETFSFSDGVKFINDAITRINVACGAIYPTYLTTDDQVVPPIPTKWAQALIIPFVCYRIKQVDSSQFEFQAFQNEFLDNLDHFQMKYTIPDAYVDLDAVHTYYPNFTNNPNQGNW